VNDRVIQVDFARASVVRGTTVDVPVDSATVGGLVRTLALLLSRQKIDEASLVEALTNAGFCGDLRSKIVDAVAKIFLAQK